MQPVFQTPAEERLTLVACALGKEPADLFIRKAKVADVNVGDVWEASIAVKNGRIAYVGPLENMVGDATQVIEAQRRYVVPGLFEAHGHGEFFYNPAHLAALAAERGTTAGFFDLTDLAAVAGAEGIRRLLSQLDSYPMRYFVGPPAVKYEASGGPILSFAELEELLQERRVLSLAELTEWMGVSGQDEELIRRVALACNLGKRAEGHTVGASKQRLQCLSAAGITSSHEPTSPDQAIECMRAGMWTMLRHGTVRKDLDDVLPSLVERGLLTSPKLILTTDVVTPADMVEHGYLDWTVRKAVSLGMPPLLALRCATLNPAIYFGLDQDLGQIAPGRLADFFLCDDLEHLQAGEVFVGGRQVAGPGLETEFPPNLSLGSLARPFRLAELDPNLLAYPSPADVEPADGRAEVPAVEIVNMTITQLRKAELPVAGGVVRADREQGVLKLAAVARDGSTSAVAFLRGFPGAFDAYASSLSDELHTTVLVLGYDDAAMMQALRRVGELGGGLVLVRNGSVAAEVPLSEGGLMTDRPWPEYRDSLAGLYSAFREAGCDLEDPLFTVRFLSFLGLPSVRITPTGLYDVMRGRPVA